MLLSPTEQREGDCAGQQPDQKDNSPEGDVVKAG